MKDHTDARSFTTTVTTIPPIHKIIPLQFDVYQVLPCLPQLITGL